MKKKIIALLILIGFCCSSYVWAHQPRLVTGTEVTQVENPEVSQAFYGELTGEPAYYQVQSNVPFRLYAGILVPDISGIDKDVSLEITKETAIDQNHDHDEGVVHSHEEEPAGFVALLDGTNHGWTHYWEEFAGDWYFEGPEFSANPEREEGVLPEGVLVDAGTYNFKVFSPDNQGKYVFVVGEKEEFPLTEIVKTYRDLPALKRDFFEKSPWTAYWNLVGLFLAIIIGIIAFIVWLIVFLIRRHRRKKGSSPSLR